jgi:hypothetical protein
VANTFSLGAHGPPLPEEMAPGRTVEGVDLRALTGTLNHLHANLVCQPAVSQEWAVNQCSRTGAKANVSVWRIPTISNDKFLLDCEIRAASAIAAGTVHFTSTNTGATATIPVTVGASAYRSIATLNVGAPAAGYDTITMAIESAGGTVTVDNVVLLFTEQTSPLNTYPATTPVGTPAIYVPFGASASAADQPLPSVRGKQIIQNISNLRARRKVLMNWSGLEVANIAASVRAKANAFMGPWSHSHVIVCNPPPARRHSSKYTCWVNVKKQAAASTYVRVLLDEGGMPPLKMFDPGYGPTPTLGDQQIEFAADAGQATEWKSTTFSMPDDLFADQIDFPNLVLTVVPGGTGAAWGDDGALSGQRIQSIVVWGE